VISRMDAENNHVNGQTAGAALQGARKLALRGHAGQSAIALRHGGGGAKPRWRLLTQTKLFIV